MMINQVNRFILYGFTMFIVGAMISGCIAHSIVSHPTGKLSRTIVHSISSTSKKPKYQEAVIPFVPTDSLIFVNAIIGHGIYPCVVDTGATAIIWPAMLNINSSPCSSGKMTMTNSDHTAQITGDCRRLPSMRIGELAFRQMASFRTFQNRFNIGNNVITLGNQAFANIVLTIDYHKRLLIVRTHQYDFTRVKPSSGSQILPFILSNGFIVFSGQVDHHPIRFMLDSGATCCALSRTFCQHYGLWEQASPGRESTPFVQATHFHIIKAANITLASLHWRESTITVEKTIDPHADGSLGVPLLKHYRVTIDYYRHKMLLEPYATTFEFR